MTFLNVVFASVVAWPFVFVTRKRSVSSFRLLCLFILVIYRVKVEGRKNKLHCRPHLMAHKMKQKT